ncbi:MAG: bifunctional adenosylcobinamide kinase/adenosylcobinamide-phosphate guanylyltransferase [Alphaproteobacteria bacterium]|nr:bifunctional adenosylcobinamide kinase/adenosylcobinamide-phosphate guanylyltransferase [Alphaproteobacteria bacterium]MBU2084278.1 bifunctional adenosylcobinamide kinase/adenosylcobinamide-phosphate guanylyltransferase [Alphaproteobacteria bacterium]MBU2141416.1 bifunctional adenosylcobinamide kinase/adenosylcobinamide-phosphate guanylyltransferase [Alphaproteobacteria bacterium]MBU2197354.1 bifunctional adenosylcobinamide kinase/adenosylcobinamide-phosphate guanylyltransferase [Alphaproteob
MTATFILGGARSGKSTRAQALAEAAGEPRVYIATAEALDEEMEARIARHKADRGAGWCTVEAPLDLVHALEAAEAPVVLVDCLTLWLSNLMHHGRDVEAETIALCACLGRYKGEVILVSNEVGLGLVPETPLGRAFRDAQGRLNQRVAAACDVVEFVAAGLPLRLKG